MTDIRMAVAVATLSRAVLEIAQGKGMRLNEHDNLVSMASITSRVKPHEIAAQLQDSKYKNAVRAAIFDGQSDEDTDAPRAG